MADCCLFRLLFVSAAVAARIILTVTYLTSYIITVCINDYFASGTYSVAITGRIIMIPLLPPQQLLLLRILPIRTYCSCDPTRWL